MNRFFVSPCFVWLLWLTSAGAGFMERISAATPNMARAWHYLDMELTIAFWVAFILCLLVAWGSAD